MTTQQTAAGTAPGLGHPPSESNLGSISHIEHEEVEEVQQSNTHLRNSDQLPSDEHLETDNPNFVPQIGDIAIATNFVNEMKNAKLDSDIEPLPTNLVNQLQEPPEHILTIDDSDDRLSLDIYLAFTNASQESYNRVQDSVLRRYADSKILTYHRVKRLVETLSGVSPIRCDMCVNSCIGYTGPFATLTSCSHRGESRYEMKKGKQVARKEFTTIPLAPQLQALRRTKEGSAAFQYRSQYTESVLEELENHEGVKQSPYTDFFDGSDYLKAVDEGKIDDNDIVVMLSIDGAQLYRNKTSDCWMYIWVILDHDPGQRYKVRRVLPGGFIPGPNKPRNTDSFLFPGLYHVSAVQRQGGIKIWDALQEATIISNIFLALVCADTPAMACMTGFVGHQGKMHCRFYCPIQGRLKDRHYYPALLKPDNFDSGHPDVDIQNLLLHFTSESSSKRYIQNLNNLIQSPNKTQYAARRLETGIVKPSIFRGLHPDHILGIPAMFSGDVMHLPALNIPDLYLSLWRGTMECDKNDNKDTWDWAVFRDISIWKEHGREVAAATPYIPGSFDRPPRNPAEKINSGYKAWEYLLYFFGLGPCLFYGRLPHKYWMQYCKLVRGVTILLQDSIAQAEIKESIIGCLRPVLSLRRYIYSARLNESILLGQVCIILPICLMRFYKLDLELSPLSGLWNALSGIWVKR